MPRQGRIHSGTGVYHVMMRGINRQRIFEDSEDYYTFLQCLRSAQEKYVATADRNRQEYNIKCFKNNMLAGH